MGLSVASLLIWVWEFASCEKRLRGRWRPGWGHQEWPGRDILFLLAKMSQDPVDDFLLLDASDDFDSPPAATANLNVDIEHTLESLGPGHSSMALGRCPYYRICTRLKCLATSGRSDFPAPSVVRCQDAVVAGEVDTRFWHQGRQIMVFIQASQVKPHQRISCLACRIAKSTIFESGRQKITICGKPQTRKPVLC